MAFKIHEDKENIDCTGQFNKFEFKNDIRNEKSRNTHRQVLGHVTNVQRNFDKNNIRIYNSSKFKEESNIFKNGLRKRLNSIIDDEFCKVPKVRKVNDITNSDLQSDEQETLILEVGSEEAQIHKYDQRLDCYSRNLYRQDIRRYLLESERKHRPYANYMKKQPEMSDSMRSILIDWLVSISDEYNFFPETLNLAISYLDRFLSKMSVVRTKLQLVGVSAMMIAAKYEEIYPPDVSEFAFLTKDTFTARQILKMEQVMLRSLSFDLTTPTVQTFIEEYTSHRSISKDLICMAMYLCELCLVDSVTFIQYLPSEMAAASLFLAHYTLDENVDIQEIENVSGYTLKHLEPVITQQYIVLRKEAILRDKPLHAVQTKYGKSSLCSVATVPLREMDM